MLVPSLATAAPYTEIGYGLACVHGPGVPAGTQVGVAVGVPAVGVAVAVAVAVGEAVGVEVGVRVAVGVGVGVGVPHGSRKRPALTITLAKSPLQVPAGLSPT